MQEMALKTLFFKIFLGSMPPDPPKGSHAFGTVGQIRVRPPPHQFLSLYAYANCSLYFKNTSSHTEKKE